MKTAILQMGDSGPLESTEAMLKVAVYKCYLPNNDFLQVLRSIGCDTLLSNDFHVKVMGYEPVDIPTVGVDWIDKCDLFCDVKAHRSYSKLVGKWPRLKGKI